MRCTPLRLQLPSVGITVILLCCKFLRVSSMWDALFHQMTESHVLCIAFYSCLLSIRLPINTSPLFYNPVYVADCGPPSFFPNGTVIYQNTTEGSPAHYHCNSGFTLEGNSTAVCGAGGNWSSTPVCGKSESGTTYLSLGTCMINNSILGYVSS